MLGQRPGRTRPTRPPSRRTRTESRIPATRTSDLPPLLLLVAGPYRSGTGDDPALIAENMRAMNEAALALFRRGHLAVTGEAVALPLIETAGSRAVGDEAFTEIFHPVAHRLLARCDGVLRIGGPSAGADEMVEAARALGLGVFTDLAEIPAAT